MTKTSWMLAAIVAAAGAFVCFFFAAGANAGNPPQNPELPTRPVTGTEGTTFIKTVFQAPRIDRFRNLVWPHLLFDRLEGIGDTNFRDAIAGVDDAEECVDALGLADKVFGGRFDRQGQTVCSGFDPAFGSVLSNGGYQAYCAGFVDPGTCDPFAAIASNSPRGIWVADTGVTERLVAYTGGPVPDADGQPMTGWVFNSVAHETPVDPALNHGNPMLALNANGKVCFRAVIRETSSGGAFRQGIWAEDSVGTLRLIAMEAASAADISGSVFVDFGPPAFNAAGHVAFYARYRAFPGAGTTVFNGLFRLDAAGFQAIVKAGDPAPEAPAAIVGEGPSLSDLFGQLPQFTSLGGGNGRDTGLEAYAYRHPDMNDAGQVVFFAELGTPAESGLPSLWVYDDGAPVAVAYRFGVAPGTLGRQYSTILHPDQAGNGLEFGRPVINASGSVAFVAGFDQFPEGPLPFEHVGEGIFFLASPGSGVELRVKRGDRAGTVVLEGPSGPVIPVIERLGFHQSPGINTDILLPEVSLNDFGQIGFAGVIGMFGQADGPRAGLFISRPGETPRLIVHANGYYDFHFSGTGGPPSTVFVKNIYFGGGGNSVRGDASFVVPTGAARGEMVFALFTDNPPGGDACFESFGVPIGVFKTHAFSPVVLGCPAQCQGDITGDGIVNSADLGRILGAWGACGSEETCCEDLNGDGNINATDLGLLLGAWNLTCEAVFFD